MEKMETTLEEMQTTQTTLINVVEKAQNYVMLDGDKDELPNVDEQPLISELIHPLAGTSGETSESSARYGSSF